MHRRLKERPAQVGRVVLGQWAAGPDALPRRRAGKRQASFDLDPIQLATCKRASSRLILDDKRSLPFRRPSSWQSGAQVPEPIGYAPAFSANAVASCRATRSLASKSAGRERPQTTSRTRRSAARTPPNGRRARIGRRNSNPSRPVRALLEARSEGLADSGQGDSASDRGSVQAADPSIGETHRRHDWVQEAVIRVLEQRAEPRQARDEHDAVEALLGEPVRWGSVKACLAANVAGSSRQFVRVGPGRYVARSVSAGGPDVWRPVACGN